MAANIVRTKIDVDVLKDSAGTGSPSFPNGITVSSATIDNISGTGPGPVNFPNGLALNDVSAGYVGAYYHGYMGNTANWSTTSATYADGTNSGGNTLSGRAGSGITVSAAASNVFGITWTPPDVNAVYEITVTTGFSNSTASVNMNAQLTDGTSVLCVANEGTSGVGSEVRPFTMNAFYAPGVNTAVTVKVQIAAPSGGTTYIAGVGSGLASGAEWSIKRIA